MGFGHWVSGVVSGAGHVAEGAWDDVHDAVVTKFGGQTYAEQDAEKASSNATKQGNSLRSQLASQDRSLASGMGYDPKSITAHENWQSYSQQQIYDTNQKSLNQDTANQIATSWRDIAKELAEIGPQLQRDAASAINGGWQGVAAEAANKTGEPLINWMQASSQAFHMTGDKIEEAGSAAGQVKASVPPPQGYSVGRTIAATVPLGLLGGGGDVLQQMKERQQAERGAQDTMARVYTPVYASVDGTVPAYSNLDNSPAPAHQPSQPSTGGGSAGAGVGGGGAGAGGIVGGAGGGGLPNMGVGGGNLGGAGAGNLGGGGAGGSSQTPNIPGGAGMPSTTQSAAYTGGAPAGVGAPSGFGGGGAGGGMAGGGMGGGAMGAAGALTAGGRAGTAGTSSASNASGRSSAGSGGTGSGSSSSSSGGAGRGGGRGGGDDEHQRPSWLEENDDVWLNDMPKTAPPVFGA